MIIEYDEITGQISAQFPDVFFSLYPAGHRVADGKDSYYRGALTISRGSERVHLNAFDIGDLETFLADERVLGVRKVMTKEHIASNMLRSILLESRLGGDGDE